MNVNENHLHKSVTSDGSELVVRPKTEPNAFTVSFMTWNELEAWRLK